MGVITTASAIPEDVFGDYRSAFSALGAAEVLDIRVRDRDDAADDRFTAMIRRSDVIFISGGDQMRLTNIFGGSPALEAIRTRHNEGAVVAGTSAGAACQSTTMVYGGPADDSLRKGAVKMAAGFGFVDGVIIDTHFLERGRFSRLMEVGTTNPEYLGVGLGEDAAVLFEGDVIRAFGPGHVILVDSSAITGSNVFDLDEGEAVTVHNVTMHALVDGYGYNLATGVSLGRKSSRPTAWSRGMRILEHRALRGPNYYSRYQAIYMRLDIEELEQRPSDKVEGIVERLQSLMPSIYEHRCSVGEAGGFLQRLRNGTYAGHVVEHIAIELQNLVGFSVGYGKTVDSYDAGIYNVIYRYRDEATGLAAGVAAVDVVQRLFDGAISTFSRMSTTSRRCATPTRSVRRQARSWTPPRRGASRSTT